MAIDNRHDEEDVDGAASSKGGNNHLYTIKSYPQLNSPPGGNRRSHLPRTRPVQSYRQVYKPTGRQSTETHTEKSTEQSTYMTMVLRKKPIESAVIKAAGWSPKRTSNDKSIPSTDDYRLQDILYKACRRTAQSADSASELELGKHNNFREAYLLDVNE